MWHLGLSALSPGLKPAPIYGHSEAKKCGSSYSESIFICLLLDEVHIDKKKFCFIQDFRKAKSCK